MCRASQIVSHILRMWRLKKKQKNYHGLCIFWQTQNTQDFLNFIHGEIEPSPKSKTCCNIITARNSSSGKVMFSQACVKNSVYKGGACVAGGGVHGRGWHAWPGGMCGWGSAWWECMAVGMCAPGQTCPWDMHGRKKWPLQRAVRILLECILVWEMWSVVDLVEPLHVQYLPNQNGPIYMQFFWVKCAKLYNGVPPLLSSSWKITDALSANCVFVQFEIRKRADNNSQFLQQTVNVYEMYMNFPIDTKLLKFWQFSSELTKT